jgi:hypothetical protein
VAAATNMKTRAVRTIVKNLVAAELLIEEPLDGRTNRYRRNLDA